MITSKAQVKLIGNLYTRVEEGAPTSASVGELGDIWLDFDSDSVTYGNTYELTDITLGVYTWTKDSLYDAKIDLFIRRAESDYLRIRGVPFDIDEDSLPVYPTDSDLTAAEMVCFLLGLGPYEGRGTVNESAGGRSKEYESKIGGYPASLVSNIKRYQAVQ